MRAIIGWAASIVMILGIVGAILALPTSAASPIAGISLFGASLSGVLLGGIAHLLAGIDAKLEQLLLPRSARMERLSQQSRGWKPSKGLF